MNQIWPIGTEIWFRTDGRTDGMDGRTDGRTHGRRQNYIPPTSSGDKKIIDFPGGQFDSLQGVLWETEIWLKYLACNNMQFILFVGKEIDWMEV